MSEAPETEVTWTFDTSKEAIANVLADNCTEEELTDERIEELAKLIAERLERAP